MAGWMFLLAKSASAATAVLGFGGYVLASTGIEGIDKRLVALGAVALFTAIAAMGVKRSSGVNIAIVAVTFLALLAFSLFAARHAVATGFVGFDVPFFRGESSGGATANLLHATRAHVRRLHRLTDASRRFAEEVVDPRRSIPKAIIATLFAIGGDLRDRVGVGGGRRRGGLPGAGRRGTGRAA
jgi:APA family basic amino acid/polyamine antiporter